MDYKIPLFFALSCLCIHFLMHCFSSKRKRSKLPPGPWPWPIFGNVFQLSNNPHRSLANLSKIYGPLMTLKLGSVTTVVVSSVDITREVFQKHDKSFSGRRVPDAVRVLDHHSYSLAWLPASGQWRNLRRISAVHLFTKQRLDATHALRQKKVHKLLEYIGECCADGQAVDIAKATFTASLNSLSNTFFSTDLTSHRCASSQEFKDLVQNITELLGKPNLAEYIPILGYFDPFGIRRDTEACLRRLFAVFDDIIRQRLSGEQSSFSTKDDVLSTLLQISKEDGSGLSIDDIKHMLMDLFTAGTETTADTIEWAMTELLRNPEKLAKAQAEMDQVLGKDGLVQESDFDRLSYLQAVVKETLRLHPPGPLLLPHKSENEVSMCGYVLPQNTQLIVNVWAMGRDPSNWENPEMFYPERFLRSEIDMRGKHFELIPFGAGRRICPGLPLAYRMQHLMLATLLKSFDWKLAGGIRAEDVDMTEKFGLSLHKAEPLLAIPMPK